MLESMTPEDLERMSASLAEVAEARVRDVARELRAFRHFLIDHDDGYEPFTPDEAYEMTMARYQCLLYEEFGIVVFNAGP